MTLDNFKLLIDSQIPIISITTPLIERMVIIREIYNQYAATKNLYLWNTGWGNFKQVKSNDQQKVQFITTDEKTNLGRDKEAILQAFDYLLNYQDNGIFIFENLPSLIAQYNNHSHQITSQLINIYFQIKTSNQSKHIIILSTDNIELPAFLTSLIPTITTQLPQTQEISQLIKQFFNQSQQDIDTTTLVNICGGLTSEEIRLGLAIASTKLFTLNKETVNSSQPTSSLSQHLLSYKINRFRSFNLNFISQPNVPNFGGLDLLKKYIQNLKQDFLPKARQANISLPKGCLLVGPPGTGKTLAAHITAKTLGFPLISIDSATILSTNTAYFKTLLQRVEASAPAVLYFDEFDKLFTPSNSPTQDGTSQQILGTLLTWLQDKKSPIFVIATLNRLDALPPELTRVGRFDEIFYVGFPQAIERQEILTMHLSRFDKRYSHTPQPLSDKQWRILLNKTVNCTSAELASIVEKAAKALFYQDKEMKIGLVELLEQREIMVPLYIRDTDRILAIENRAKYISQPASSPDKSQFAPTIKSLWGEDYSFQ